MGFHLSPVQKRIKNAKLLRVGFILMLIGFSISLIPSVAIALAFGGIYSGSYMFYYLFYFIGIFGGMILTGLGSLLSFAGYIVIIVAFAQLSQIGSNPELKKKAKITMVLFIVTLSVNFLVNAMSIFTGGPYSFIYSFLYSLYGYGTTGLTRYLSLFVTGLFLSSFILLSLTMKELKIDKRVGNKGIVSVYVYPVVIITQIVQLIDFGLDPLMTILVTSIISGVVEFVVLIILASEGLTASSKIYRSYGSQIAPTQHYRPEPVFLPQETPRPTGKGGKFCIKCGTTLVQDARFCGNCGHKIDY